MWNGRARLLPSREAPTTSRLGRSLALPPALSRRSGCGHSPGLAPASGDVLNRAQTMIPKFVIDRPIFATVLSVLITLTGLIALFTLPVAQYPRITPPGVSVSISYPGASAQVIADTVAAPIEQQVTGVPGMLLD